MKLVFRMVDKPAEQKLWPQTVPEVTAPPEELDLKLEKESVPENEPVEQKTVPEQPRPQKPRSAIKPRPAMPLPAKDPVMVKIEKIMEEGLNDSYQRLSPVAKQEFKLKGEQAASQIRELLKSTHVKVKKILRLILDWLRILPGINHFFLEQEAKIKTDKIIALKEKF
ncbi:MAG: Uncharacterized protein G01um101413_318 [Parcubacteria group bacterium Gr01-1014_13]|nr:MAG: Uncharacterized protein G01um101413_318 [Parcubacteria group bacterium Gr01-1014_13]